MKIFYAVQATGNGHIARAIELLPYLQKYGSVHVFLSGSNSSLPTNAALPVEFTSKGVSLMYSKSGGLNYWKTIKNCNPIKVYREAKQLPIEKFDVVINDFDCITSLACRLKKIPSISFGHQASFKSMLTPRPQKRDFLGENVLQHFAPATKYIGLHFESYDQDIYSPILKKEILESSSVNEGHVTVYLPHYDDFLLLKHLRHINHTRFEIFTKRVTQPEVNKNITFLPIGNQAFCKSMLSSKGIITGGGFETPAEALYLGKQLMILPIRGQYEQQCNAAALEKFGIPVLQEINHQFTATVRTWLNTEQNFKLQLQHSTAEIVARVIQTAESFRREETTEIATQNFAQQLIYTNA
ncbi:MAG: hypothetical protein RLY16_1709 [Bacteroidota bacterium]